MNRTSVRSSNIASIGHDPATNKLEIEFSNGSVYSYSDVPAEKHTALMTAPSIGMHFAKNIRGVHPAVRES